MFQIKKLLSVIIPFFSFQVLIQFIDALSGIILVRNLVKSDYAFLGIAGIVVSSVLNIAISGLSSYLISSGVQVRDDKTAISRLLITIQRFVNPFKYAFIACSIPILFFLLYRNGMGASRIAIIIVFVCTDIFFRVEGQLYQCVLNIYGKFNYLQTINLCGTICRFLLVIGCYYFLNAEIAVAGMLLSYFVQYILAKNKSKVYILPGVSPDFDHFKPIRSLYISQLPITIYNAFDSQIGVFLLSVFGTTELIADINAAARLSLIIVAINAFINNYVLVKLSAINDYKLFRKRVFFMLRFFTVTYFVCVTLMYFFPGWFIWLIGEKYSNIEPFLYLTVINLCINHVSGVIYAVNFSKMWIKKNWIIIPVTLVVQVIGIYFIGLSSFQKVTYYTFFCMLPNLVINAWFCYKGMKQMEQREIESAVKMPAI
ncbi:MAG: hypothetical protein JST39_03865 [Bacteroidetes bacterium]|nr:hypothetical protein [Bacteroidota bacterium]